MRSGATLRFVQQRRQGWNRTNAQAKKLANRVEIEPKLKLKNLQTRLNSNRSNHFKAHVNRVENLRSNHSKHFKAQPTKLVNRVEIEPF
jgi:hypothetical protein